jgi:hypothetical protein
LNGAAEFLYSVTGFGKIEIGADMRRTPWKKILLALVLGLPVLCLVAGAASYLSNQSLPQHSPVIEHLSSSEKARISEAQAVRKSLGNQVWPGFGDADLPVLAYNEQFGFLVNDAQPSTGWVKVPATETSGSMWVPVPGDQFQGKTYYYQPVDDGASAIGSFTVKIGERWAASLVTLDWGKIEFVKMFREDILPSVVADLAPYRLILPLFLNTDQYIFAYNHEAFHAFQGELAPEKLIAAELAVRSTEADYPWDDEGVDQGWQAEFSLLQQALRSESLGDTRDLAVKFLAARNQRRALPVLNSGQIQYEQQREWLEGLARYVELELWRAAYESDSYQPTPAIQQVADFNNFRSYPRQWSSMVSGMTQQTSSQDTRFYSSGLAQAVLLDRLLPNWKSKAMETNVYLDQLLAEAVASN